MIKATNVNKSKPNTWQQHIYSVHIPLTSEKYSPCFRLNKNSVVIVSAFYGVSHLA